MRQIEENGRVLFSTLENGSPFLVKEGFEIFWCRIDVIGKFAEMLL